PHAPHEGIPAKALDEVAETVVHRVAEADDPGDESAFMVLSPHPVRRRDGIRGASGRPHDAPNVHHLSLAVVVDQRVVGGPSGTTCVAKLTRPSSRRASKRNVTNNPGSPRWSVRWPLQSTTGPSIDTP